MPAMLDGSIPVILGPTASSKTDVGIELAKLIDGEVISVDSRKVYRGLMIGTATPAGEWKNGVYVVRDVPHHLIHNVDPDKPYTAGDFAKDAERAIEGIKERGKRPILVGGTGFYFKALQEGLPTLPKRDEELRAQMTARIQAHGLSSLFAELERIDPAATRTIKQKDSHKIIRALEVYYLTGRPFSMWKRLEPQQSRYTYAVIGLHYPKTILEKRIEERSKRMYDQGMIDEAEYLLRQGFPKTCPALASFGYREAVQVLEKKLSMRQFLPRLVQGTKAYAKRQRTWFRTQVAPYWFDCTQFPSTEQMALKLKAFLESLN